MPSFWKYLHKRRNAPLLQKYNEQGYHWVKTSTLQYHPTPGGITQQQKAFALGDFYATSADYYENYITNIRAVSPTEVMEIANKYYNPEDMCEVVVGGK